MINVRGYDLWPAVLKDLYKQRLVAKCTHDLKPAKRKQSEGVIPGRLSQFHNEPSKRITRLMKRRNKDLTKIHNLKRAGHFIFPCDDGGGVKKKKKIPPHIYRGPLNTAPPPLDFGCLISIR